MDDDRSLRKHLERRYEVLKAERARREPGWREQAALIKPWMGHFDTEDHSARRRVPTEDTLEEEVNPKKTLLDSEASRAHTILAAGLTSGLTGPSRDWFRLNLPDPELSNYKPVKEWLDDLRKAMQWIFQRTNTYRALASVYEELGVFGTAVTVWQPDPQDFMRGYTLTAGEYYLANGPDLEVDTLYRRIHLTVAQVVEQFGLDRVGRTVRTLWDKGDYDEEVHVVHAIEPNRWCQKARLGPLGKRWLSVYWEPQEGNKDSLLATRGMDFFPVTAPRWDLLLHETYGHGPGEATLPDIRQLQAMEFELHSMLALQARPPLQGVANLARRPEVYALPGAVTFLDSPTHQLSPLYEIRPDVNAFAVKIEEIRRRLNAGFFTDAFVPISNLNRSRSSSQFPTAYEIGALQEEKLVVLGPVLERLHHGLLERLIDFTMDLVIQRSLPGWRTGGRAMIPPPPPELEGIDLQVDFVSPLAQAQRAVGTAAIERVASFAGHLAATDPTVMRKLNTHHMVEEYAALIGAAAKILRSDEEIAAEEAAAAQQQQMQQTMQMGLAGVKGAELLSKTNVGGSQNALQALLGRT